MRSPGRLYQRVLGGWLIEINLWGLHAQIRLRIEPGSIQASAQSSRDDRA
jgi:hypothetical protein